MRRRLLLLLSLLLVIAVNPAPAEGPFAVGGPPQSASFPNGIPNSVPGKPFVWTLNPLTYWTDQGKLGALGSLTNPTPEGLVADAFQEWENVPTATITFSQAGQLGGDVSTGPEFFALEDAILACSTPLSGVARDRSIVYDSSGAIIDAVYGTGSSDTTLGFATAACLTSDGVTNRYNRGYAVLNGKGITTANALTDLLPVMIHEFGHMIGLDHSQINVECLGPFGCSADALQGLPTMFPILVDGAAMSTPATDDIAGLSELYPETVNNPPTQIPYLSTTGRITGLIKFSDGVTQAQGFNVIARMVDNPVTSEDESKIKAVSSSSGFLFTGDNGNPLVQINDPFFGTPSAFGSRDVSRIGYYEIPGLPPGNYTVEVEAIDSSFIEGSGIGPLGALNIVFPLPSAACPDGEFWNSAEDNNDVCTDSTPVTVTTGVPATGKDIILNGTGPRYDAWEDGP